MSKRRYPYPYSFWGILEPLMMEDKRFAIAMYLSVGCAFGGITLYLFTGQDAFRWLAYASIPCLIVTGIWGNIAISRNSSEHKQRRKPKR